MTIAGDNCNKMCLFICLLTGYPTFGEWGWVFIEHCGIGVGGG